MAAESRLQKKIREDLERDGWLVLKIILCNKNGFPDLVPMKKKGKIFFIEVKRPGEDADELQKIVHAKLRQMGFNVFVIDTWEKYLNLKKRL